MSSDPGLYDRDRRERQSATRLLWWFGVVVVGFYVMVQVYNAVIGPYAGFVYDRWERVQESIGMITSDTCSNMNKIAEVGSYRTTCELARKRIVQGVVMGAFHDLMNKLSMCDRGICYIGPVNVTSVFFYMTIGALLMGVFVWCFGLVQFTSAYHARNIGNTMLPTVAPPLGGGGGYMLVPAPPLQAKPQPPLITVMQDAYTPSIVYDQQRMKNE